MQWYDFNFNAIALRTEVIPAVICDELVYDRLVVNPTELKIVQEIFTRYANKESVTAILNDLNARGVKTKRWRTRTGKIKAGKAFHRNAIYTLLKNRIYLSEVFNEAMRDMELAN